MTLWRQRNVSNVAENFLSRSFVRITFLPMVIPQYAMDVCPQKDKQKNQHELLRGGVILHLQSLSLAN